MAGFHHVKPINWLGEEDLHRVVTLTEACQVWYRHRSVLRYAIDAGLINARKSGNTWLVSVHSLVRRYGLPPERSRKA